MRCCVCRIRRVPALTSYRGGRSDGPPHYQRILDAEPTGPGEEGHEVEMRQRHKTHSDALPAATGN